MSFNELELRDRIWTVSCGERPVAEIHLDYWHQVGDVVLYADTSPAMQLSVLRLAASHVQQYVKHRTTSAFGGLMVAEHRDPSLTAYDSQRLMSSLFLEEGQTLDRETIEKEFRTLNIGVIVAVHRTAGEALQAVIAQVGRPGLQCRRMAHLTYTDNEIKLRFTVAKPDHFIFWKSEWKPGVSDLHIVPGYHPVMNGGEAVGIVNGATDCYIRGNAVRSIYCPKAARSDRRSRSFGSTWNHVKHPFYAIGRSFSIALITTNIRSREGVKELVELLRGALGEGKRYVEISGGFRAPMKCAHNRLLETGKPSPYPRASRDGRGHVARGSEEHCVWAYRTLEKEGTLKQARVPDWFIREGWLGIYKGAEVRPTLF